jgi:nicotinamidase/pyrazinamidase
MEVYIRCTDDLELNEKDAIIVVDAQIDFMPGGALQVPDGDRIVPGINSLVRRFPTAVYTRDWHPDGHKSFASAHKGKRPMDPVDLPGLGPVLWPDHCIQGKRGADFHQDIDIRPATLILHKGTNREIDSYSAFLENDKKTETGLDGYLKNRGIERIFICGLALDYCVFYTAMDGINKGFRVCVVLDLSAPIDVPAGSKKRVIKVMQENGISFYIHDKGKELLNMWYGDVDIVKILK